MSYRIVLLPWATSDGKQVDPDPANGPFDAVIPEGAELPFIEEVARQWSVSPIGRPLKIYTPSAEDPRLSLLRQLLDDEYAMTEDECRVIVAGDF